MTKNIIFPTLLLLAATPNVCAQTAMPMTLEQLFERVEQGSCTLAAAKTNVDAAQHGIDAALSQRLPDLSANLSVSYIGNALLTDRDFSNAHGLHSPHLGNSFAIEAQEAIYTGGALSAGIKLAELGKKQAETGVVLTRQQARFLALGQYLDLYKVDNRMRVYRENMSLTRQLIADIKQRQQQGMALKNDITRYELQMEQLSLGLEQLQNTRKILNHQLCNTLALPQQTNVQPDTTLVSASLPRDPEAAWQNRSTTTSPLLEQSRLNIGIAQQKERIAKSELLPKVAIVAANNFDGPITFELPPIDKNLNIWYVGVGVKYNIGALYKKNKQVRQAAAQTQIAQQQYNVQREAVDNRTNAAYIKYMQTYTEFDTQRKSVELARQNYNVVNARYLGQLALITDMVDASNIKLDAELQEVDARINILYAYYQLKYAAGEI
ncbi:TolC family protein [Prevotella sp.]|uniref:TolC family protein n=1 Tax=Prevotella sp. TaxID=59823 RepID=UPI0027E2671A|nr:TolC family protein [Prevotella sp.]